MGYFAGIVPAFLGPEDGFYGGFWTNHGSIRLAKARGRIVSKVKKVGSFGVNGKRGGCQDEQ
jgi:hypothetical protein